MIYEITAVTIGLAWLISIIILMYLIFTENDKTK